MGGSNGTSLDTLEAYDPSTNSWSIKTHLPGPRQQLAATSMNGLLFVAGGVGATNTVEVYDPAANQWRPESTLLTNSIGLGLGAVHGELIAVGGIAGEAGDNEAATLLCATPLFTYTITNTPTITTDPDAFCPIRRPPNAHFHGHRYPRRDRQLHALTSTATDSPTYGPDARPAPGSLPPRP